MDSWRESLYPLGFISTCAFAARFMIQWWASEKAQCSANPPLFWKLSVWGNISLLIHSLIQVHFPLAALQSCHIVIAWRNLSLIYKKPRVPLPAVICLIAIAFLVTALLFFIQSFWLEESLSAWIRNPSSYKEASTASIPPFWHLFGILGLVLFSGRFWVQWWMAEKQQLSELSDIFWWLSLGGSIILISYFSLLRDWVNLMGPLFGIFIYVRNLVLLHHQRHKARRPNP